FNKRAEDFTAGSMAKLPVPPELGLAFGPVALAKLLVSGGNYTCAADNLDAESLRTLRKGLKESLRDTLNKVQVKQRVGTDVTGLHIKMPDPFGDIDICKRTGDYDMALIGLLRLLYAAGNDRSVIDPATYSRVLHDLLTERGGASQVQTMTSGGMCGFSIGETENHQYMTESSRY